MFVIILLCYLPVLCLASIVLMVGFSSLYYTVNEAEDQQLTYTVVKRNMTDVKFTVQIKRVFLNGAPDKAFPDCPALGTSKCVFQY